MCQHDANMQSEKVKNTIAEIAKGLEEERISFPNHPNNDKYCSDGSGAALTIRHSSKPLRELRDCCISLTTPTTL